MLKHLSKHLLIVGLLTDVANCNNYALVCLDDQRATVACQSNFGYYCSETGRIQYRIWKSWCSEVCRCVSLLPRPRYFVQESSVTLSNFRGENSTDTSTIFEFGDYQDVASIDILERFTLRSCSLGETRTHRPNKTRTSCVTATCHITTE